MPVTTDSDHKLNIAPNPLDRDFKADAPNQKWLATSAMFGRVRAGILDMHSRRVIGWAVSNRMKRDLAIRALKMAIAFRAPPKGCIHHTDRGSQYCSHDYQKILRQNGFKVPLSHACLGKVITMTVSERALGAARNRDKSIKNAGARLHHQSR